MSLRADHERQLGLTQQHIHLQVERCNKSVELAFTFDEDNKLISLPPCVCPYLHLFAGTKAEGEIDVTPWNDDKDNPICRVVTCVSNYKPLELR